MWERAVVFDGNTHVSASLCRLGRAHHPQDVACARERHANKMVHEVVGRTEHGRAELVPLLDGLHLETAAVECIKRHRRDAIARDLPDTFHSNSTVQLIVYRHGAAEHDPLAAVLEPDVDDEQPPGADVDAVAADLPNIHLFLPCAADRELDQLVRSGELDATGEVELSVLFCFEIEQADLGDLEGDVEPRVVDDVEHLVLMNTHANSRSCSRGQTTARAITELVLEHFGETDGATYRSHSHRAYLQIDAGVEQEAELKDTKATLRQLAEGSGDLMLDAEIGLRALEQHGPLTSLLVEELDMKFRLKPYDLGERGDVEGRGADVINGHIEERYVGAGCVVKQLQPDRVQVHNTVGDVHIRQQDGRVRGGTALGRGLQLGLNGPDVATKRKC
eukprot:PhM_4_TR11251/c0_g1_i1/m.70044